MTESTAKSALAITVVGRRLVVDGSVASPADRQALRDQATVMLTAIHGTMPQLVIDVSRAKYVDSLLLGVLVGIARRGAAIGVRIALEGADPELVKLLRLTHVDDVLASRGARIGATP